jgi:hypothetical protein
MTDPTTPTDQPSELTYEKALDYYVARHGKGWTGLFNCPCAECRKAVALLAPHKKTEPSELDAIRARVDEIEHLHTRADLHLISEILKAAGYTCEIRDDEEWWSNGGVWSSQADAYGMLQFEDMLEVAKLCRRLLELLDDSELESSRKDVRMKAKDSEIESLRRELAEAKLDAANLRTERVGILRC